MSETYPLAFPTNTGIAKIQITARSAVAVAESPLSFTQQAVSHSGQAWGASVSLPPTNRADAEAWNSFQLRLRGRSGTFTMGDPVAASSRGIASWWPGTPLIKGASQTGGTVVIDGAPANQTAYLMVGDYIQIGTSLHKVLEDANSDATGQVTLNIWPNLRGSPADNSAVIVKNAVGIFRLSSNVVSWDIETAMTYGINFSAGEAL